MAGDNLLETVASRTMPVAGGKLAPGSMLGQYRIEHMLGRGGMGEVYAAIHPLIGKRVAVKVIRADRADGHGAIDRFIQEARAVNQIGHPNIVDIFGFGTLDDARPYCVMEHLVGETLRERLARAPMTLADVAHICDGITRALAAAHARGIVHRDLKPENIFLVERQDEVPTIKLLDFGLAKLAEPAELRAEQTETGALLGTPRYLAPEQASGGAIDARTDIYALGAVVFEMLAGRPMFDGATAIELVAHHLTTPPPRVSAFVTMPGMVDELILGMVAKDPAERPTLEEARRALLAIGNNPPRRRHRRVAALTVLAVGLVTAAWLVVRDESSGTVGVTPAPATAPSATRGLPTPFAEPPVDVEPAPVVAPATDPPRSPSAVPSPRVRSGGGSDVTRRSCRGRHCGAPRLDRVPVGVPPGVVDGGEHSPAPSSGPRVETPAGQPRELDEDVLAEPYDQEVTP